VAAAGHQRVGRPGVGVHAAADAGVAGAPGLRGLARALAHARCAGSRAERRGGARVGTAGLPAPRAAPACVRRGDHRGARRRGPGHPGPTARAPGRRGLHRRCGGLLRLRAGARGAGHERPPGAGPRRVGHGVPAALGHPCRARSRRNPRAGDAPRGLGGRGDGTRRSRVHRGKPTVRALPDPRPVRLARGWPACVRRPAAEGADLRRHCRQCRGRLLAVVREAEAPVPLARLAAAWADEQQRGRALAGLVEDGLLVARGGGYALPG
jgi:hypothetical protein